MPNPIEDKFVYELLRDFLRKSYPGHVINYAAWKKGVLETMTADGDIFVFDSIDDFKHHYATT